MSWRIHLGAHKTASTHLQNVLEALDVMPPHRSQRAASKAIFGDGASLDALFDHRVLSEENWLGEIDEACAWPPYPRLRVRMARLRDASGGDAQAFLSIRSPASFISATYGQALRNTPNRVSLKRVRRQWEGRSPWIAIAETIADFFPLTIWRYEDYRDNAKAIVEMVSGSQIAALPEIADPPATIRPSQDAVEAIERGRNLLGRINYDKAQRMLARSPGDKFAMFADTAAMDEAYERELAELSRRGWLMRFD